MGERDEEVDHFCSFLTFEYKLGTEYNFSGAFSWGNFLEMELPFCFFSVKNEM
mgnify:CR=1 FL=1